MRGTEVRIIDRQWQVRVATLWHPGLEVKLAVVGMTPWLSSRTKMTWWICIYCSPRPSSSSRSQSVLLYTSLRKWQAVLFTFLSLSLMFTLPWFHPHETAVVVMSLLPKGWLFLGYSVSSNSDFLNSEATLWLLCTITWPPGWQPLWGLCFNFGFTASLALFGIIVTVVLLFVSIRLWYSGQCRVSLRIMR